MSLEGGSLPLAALRIVVALLWLLVPQVHGAASWARVPITTVPTGSAWLVPLVDPVWAGWAHTGVVIGAMFGLLGLWARPGFALVTVCGTYLLAIPQMHGAVQHTHHLLWLAALLAVSPASDALSVRQWRPLQGRSLGWGVPVRMAWLVLAAIYFFPGVHKLAVQGPGWAGENLTLQLYWKWAESWHFTPLTRIDRWPTLLWLGGLAVLLFEVGAPLLLLTRWTRLGFAVAAGLFHLATALWLDIHFWALWVCFVVMLPFPEPDGPGVTRPWWPAALVGTGLLAGIVATGATATTQGWPFACYPTFDQPVGRWMPTLLVVGVDAEGREHLVPERALADDGQRFYGEAWGLLGLYGPVGTEPLAAFWARVERRPGVQAALGPSVSVTLYRGSRSVEPDAPEVRRGEALLTVPVSGR